MPFVTGGVQLPAFSSADNSSWLAKAYGREVVLSSGDRNAFSCLGYVTSYSVVIKYRPFTGLGKGGVQLTSSRCCGMGRGWSKAAQDKGDE